MKTWLCQGSRIWHHGEKDQCGFSYRLHYRESCASTCPEPNFWAIRRNLVVSVDRLVSYPLVFIHLRHNIRTIETNLKHLVMLGRFYYTITSSISDVKMKEYCFLYFKNSFQIRLMLFQTNSRFIYLEYTHN